MFVPLEPRCEALRLTAFYLTRAAMLDGRGSAVLEAAPPATFEQPKQKAPLRSCELAHKTFNVYRCFLVDASA